MSTFQRVDGQTMKLTDFTFKPAGETKITAKNFAIQLLDEEGGTQSINEENLKGIVPGDEIEGFLEDHDGESLEFCFHSTSGNWYLTCDDERDYPANDFEVPFGNGVLMTANDALEDGGFIQFSGAVSPDPINSPVCEAACYMLTGNVAPVDMEISEFAVVAAGETKITAKNFAVQLLDEEGGTQSINEENLKGIVPDDEIEGFLEDHDGESLEFCFHSTSGNWYLTCDDERDYPANDFVVKAGMGLLLAANDALEDGGMLQLPSALTEKE